MKSRRITNKHIQDVLEGATFESIKMGDKTTVVQATLPNGFVITESSSCVDPDNYDHAVGSGICKERIINKIWELEGYLLQNRLAEEKTASRIMQRYSSEKYTVLDSLHKRIDLTQAQLRILEKRFDCIVDNCGSEVRFSHTGRK